MRLNRVELFYVFVVAIGSEGSTVCGRGATTYGLAAYRGGHPWPSSLQEQSTALEPSIGRPLVTKATIEGNAYGHSTHRWSLAGIAPIGGRMQADRCLPKGATARGMWRSPTSRGSNSFPIAVLEPKFSYERFIFKLHVMRLNRVESFYAFLLRFRSEGSKERGRPAMARPSTRAADHGHTPCRGGRPRLAPLQGRSATTKAFCGGSHLRKAVVPPTARPQGVAVRGVLVSGGRQRPACKGQLVATSLQGATSSSGGGASRKGPSPPAEGRRRRRSEGKEG
ncbi:hypothetical protein BHE74_00034028 [Ensete ventricosum]|nr:hypothetical protein BHE74_00034028 [Ensete ventricosum]